MKPRTFRRVVLIGSLVAVVLVVGLGYFVLRPWQTQRKFNAMRTDGMAAYEAGDYQAATKHFARYLKNSDQPEPQIILDYARARLKVQSSDGGYIRAAVGAYRNYLNRVPDDVEAAQELLPLLNVMGMYVEAKSLAQDLRNKHGDQRIETLREERIARDGLKEGSEEIEPLLKAAAESPDWTFADLYLYAGWLQDQDRSQDAKQLVDDRLGQDPDSLPARLVAYWYSLFAYDNIDATTVANLSDELAEIVGLDPDTAQWKHEPGKIDAVMAQFLDQRFNLYSRPDLSLAVREWVAQHEQDSYSATLAARRLYWQRQRDRLNALDVDTEDGEPVPDVVGYQILMARNDDDQARLDELNKELDSIQLDFRGRAWRDYLGALDELDGGDLVKARLQLRKALDSYGREPTFHFEMGNLHAKLGRFSDARDEWLLANRYANGSSFDQRLPGEQDLGPVGWIEPLVRLVEEYGKANRLPEAVEYLQELGRIAPTNAFANNLVLRTVASMARGNQLKPDKAVSVLTVYENGSEQYTAEYKRDIAPHIATLYAYLGQREQAQEVIRSAITSEPSQSQLATLLDVDQHYKLGVAADVGIDTTAIAGANPAAALRHALNMHQETGEVQPGLEFIEQNAKKAEEADAYGWALAKTKYLDSVGDERAMGAWDAMIKDYPERVDLLYQAAESDAYSADLAKLDTLISTIMEKTGTTGQITPSRLRLARASALVRTVRTRQTRDQAIELVRAVVATEPDNIKARNMLGRLLSMRPTPPFTPETSFDPDYAGAITQYITIARLIDGRGAQIYLLEAIDLAIENGDTDKARQYLGEFDTRFGNDLATIPEIARRYVNLNMFKEAIEIYQRIQRSRSASEDQIIATGLLLADLYLTQGDKDQGLALLSDLKKADSLSADQLAQLASLYARYGNKPEGDDLASSGEHYGLNPAESKMAYAKYADAYISEQAYLDTLRELVEIDPENGQAWKMLARRLVRLKEFEQAQEVVAQAKTHLTDDSELRSLALLAQGEPESATGFLNASGVDLSPQKKEAAKRVDEYTALPDTTTAATREKMLRSMLDDFPDFPPMQQFALSSLNDLPADPKLVAAYADSASRVMPGNPVVMRIGCEAYLNSNPSRPLDAMRLAKLWRANTAGSVVEPDAVTARAMIQLGNYDECVSLLQPHVLAAIEHPDRQISLEVLYAYSQAMLLRGEDPELTAARLEPLLAGHAGVRNLIWLNLAVSSVPTAEVGADWIQRLVPYATEDEKIAIAGAWVGLAERFQAWGPEYVQSAIDTLSLAVENDGANDPSLSVTLARAYAALARGEQDAASKAQDYEHAIAQLVRADSIDPSNLFYLMQAASLANEAENDSRAESLYKRLMAKDLPEGGFKASVMNNLAMVMERLYSDQESLNKAHELAVEATEAVDNSSFWGTRGWVELAMGDATQAETSFQRAVDLSGESPEGWVGLAITFKAEGKDDTDEAREALGRVRGFVSGGQLDADLRRRLKEHGIQE